MYVYLSLNCNNNNNNNPYYLIASFVNGLLHVPSKPSGQYIHFAINNGGHLLSVYICISVYPPNVAPSFFKICISVFLLIQQILHLSSFKDDTAPQSQQI